MDKSAEMTEKKTLQTYHKIMEVLITETPSDENGKFITYPGIHQDGHFVRIDVIGVDYPYRDAIKARLKDEFNVDDMVDANVIWLKEPNHKFESSYKFKNEISNADEKMEIVVYPRYVAIGIYTGGYYDCEFIYEK